MAKQKGNIDRNIIRGIVKDSKNAVQDVSRTLASGKLQLKNNSNVESIKLQYIDVNLIVDAPDSWNKYPRLKKNQPDKYFELKMSILQHGIKQPLVLWKQTDTEYMVLAGHNRKDICIEILNELSSGQNAKEIEKYQFVPAIVYKKEELNDDAAIKIIDGTNIYRDFSRLPRKIQVEISRNRVENYDRSQTKKEQMDKVAKELGILSSSLYENIRIANNIYEPLQELYYSGKITRKQVLRLGNYTLEMQKWIFDTYNDKLTGSKISMMKKNMLKEDIAKIFDVPDIKTRRITIDVPEDLLDEFNIMFSEWLKNKKLLTDTH